MEYAFKDRGEGERERKIGVINQGEVGKVADSRCPLCSHHCGLFIGFPLQSS
jgi:hypothetical protein